MGRFTDEDARVRSVRAMEKRYHVDSLQADRVEATVVALLEQVESEWGLEDPLAESVLRGRRACTRVGWTSRIPSITGTAPTCCSMPTCRASRARSSLLLSALVGGHRRQLSFESLEDLLPPWDRHAEFLTVICCAWRCCCIGAAVRSLCRKCSCGEGPQPELELPQRWMKEHPLTLEDLEQERGYLKEAGFRLRTSFEPLLKYRQRAGRRSSSMSATRSS
jgi:exopolyphosphatase/guanosine-5'-triphosphate,3'-diphosphate pyrophosphatase